MTRQRVFVFIKGPWGPLIFGRHNLKAQPPSWLYIAFLEGNCKSTTPRLVFPHDKEPPNHGLDQPSPRPPH